MTESQDRPAGMRWEQSLEQLDREIARMALLCRVRILDPAVLERVLRNDPSVCETPNPIAFANYTACSWCTSRSGSSLPTRSVRHRRRRSKPTSSSGSGSCSRQSRTSGRTPAERRAVVAQPVAALQPVGDR
jgi:hypothetical protein